MQQQSKLIPRPRLMNQVLRFLDEAPVTVRAHSQKVGKMHFIR
jgi:hypothetical protein